ncbi:MAG: DUF262 domain-containing protein [Nitrospira sp.]|nr:DUF262 domain-containing protein [Nitrospira sp.]
MKFEITELRSNTVWSLYRMRDRIQLDPDYQRMSDIWTLDKRQLLIDTILNDFDIPKLYLHKFYKPLKKDKKTYDYAIIDGKQRLETMWAFIDGHIALAEDFEYYKDSDVSAEGMYYVDVGQKYPDLKVQFDSFQLAAICIETDDLEMIEEMFSRLNESAPLTAPEKRNAYPGPLPNAIRKLAGEQFFTAKLPFTNRRYRHYDLAAKFLLAESSKKVVDTKKAYLDKFVSDYVDKPRNTMPTFYKQAQDNVKHMAAIFTQKDALLRQVGMVVLYYHLFRIATANGWEEDITRKKLLEFDILREDNRKRAEKDITKANYDLMEFDRHTQSPNDAYALKFRLKIILRDAFGHDFAIEQL